MAKFALVNDFVVTDVVELDEEAEQEAVKKNSLVVAIDLNNSSVEKGWVLVGSKFFPKVLMTQFDRDILKYRQRASVKDKIISEMAAENMARVREGVWNVSTLIALTQDQELKLLLDDINTLSFELAIMKIQTIKNVMISDEIKASWILKLQRNLF